MDRRLASLASSVDGFHKLRSLPRLLSPWRVVYSKPTICHPSSVSYQMVTGRSLNLKFVASLMAISQVFCSLPRLSLTELAPPSNHLLAAPLFPTQCLAVSHCPYSSCSHPQELSLLFQDDHHRNQCPLERGIACETMSDFPIYRRPTRVTSWPLCRLLCAPSLPQ